MVSYFTLAVAALTVAWLVNNYRKLSANIAAAKRSGLPYVIVPIFTFNRFWLVTHKLWLRLLRRLPNEWTESWIPYVDMNARHRYSTFAYPTR